MRYIDLTGQRFGRLVVTAKADRPAAIKGGSIYWHCQCDCGNTIITAAYSLKRGDARSCTCLSRDNAKKLGSAKLRHGHSRNGKSPEYRSYLHAKGRCTNPNDSDYYLYGERGVEFRFTSFEEFYAEVGDKPTRKHSIDRIDTNGHYEKGNIKWSTSLEQNHNRRNTVMMTAFGQEQCQGAWAKSVNMPVESLRRRLQSGWCNECALTLLPYQGRCPHKTE